MKILVITHWLVRWNGMSRVVYELSRRFKKDHEVRIVVYKDYIDSEWEKEFEIYKLQYKGLFALKEIRTILKEYRPDIIHSHGWLGLLALSPNVPQVATTHSNWPMNWFFSMRNFVEGLIQEVPHEIKMHLTNEVVSVSEYQREKLKSRGIRSKVIYNGVDEEFLNPPDDQIELEHPSVLFVGGVDKRKAKYLVPFIELLNRKSGKVHTYVIGAPADKNIVRKVKRLENTHYLGVVDDVKPYYHSADVLVFTSMLEACPLVPIEAQASGLPVVAFDVCSNAELIKNGETGFLVKIGDLNGIMNKTLEIIENDDLREGMGANCVRNAKNNFLWDDKAEKYVELFKEVHV